MTFIPGIVGCQNGNISQPETVLLWDFEGTNGASPLNDTDLTGNITISIVDNSEYSSSSPIYGSTSLVTNESAGNRSSISTNTTSKLASMDKNVTIECSFIPSKDHPTLALEEEYFFILDYGSSPGIQSIRVGVTNSQIFLYVGSNQFFGASSFSLDVKNDWAVTRSNGVFYFFLDGSLVSSGTNASPPSNKYSQSKVVLYTQVANNSQTVSLKHDSIRIIIGEALYTSNYTPTGAQLVVYP